MGSQDIGKTTYFSDLSEINFKDTEGYFSQWIFRGKRPRSKRLFKY